MIQEREISALIEAAKRKDNAAIAALYEHMHHKIYFSASLDHRFVLGAGGLFG